MINDYSSSYLDELKRRLHILHSHDDQNLRDLMKTAHAKVKGWCGQFDLDDEVGKNLVFEFVRFAYNGKAENFYESYKSDLVDYGFTLMEVNDEEQA